MERLLDVENAPSTYAVVGQPDVSYDFTYIHNVLSFISNTALLTFHIRKSKQQLLAVDIPLL